jgi:ABC-type Fe3+/spermidine/putrescine transport system ATPase subunit
LKIQLEHVYKRFEKKEVLQDINLSIKEGEFIALLGPSGCGKTTLLNALAGFLDIDDGSIAVGDDIWSTGKTTLPPERRSVGMVFQDFALWPHLTVFENVAFGLKVKRMGQDAIRHRVNEVLSIVQMNGYEKVFPHQLSGGQKQRIAIARALAPNPTVLLMDEPLSSLDAKLREQMRWDLLSIIRAARITTIYVTHDQIEALSMADRIVLLNSGRIEQMGTPQELYGKPKTEFAAYFMGASNLLQVEVEREDGEGTIVKWNGTNLRVTATEVRPEHPVVLLRPSDIRISATDGGRATTDSAAAGDSAKADSAKADSAKETAAQANNAMAASSKETAAQANNAMVASSKVNDGVFEASSGLALVDKAASLRGTIVQRAYQGATWLYQVLPFNARSDSKLLEVWSQSEFTEGQDVLIHIPDNGGKLVEGQQPTRVAR